MTSFVYDDKKARDVGLTCSCHLSNIIPDSIFHESIRQGITCFFFCFFFPYLFAVCLFVFVLFLRGDTYVFLRMKEMESVLSL